MGIRYPNDYSQGELLKATDVNDIKNNGAIQVDTVAELASVDADVNIAYVVADKSLYQRDSSNTDAPVGWVKMTTSKELATKQDKGNYAASSHGSHVPGNGAVPLGQWALSCDAANTPKWANLHSYYVPKSGGTFTGAVTFNAQSTVKQGGWRYTGITGGGDAIGFQWSAPNLNATVNNVGYFSVGVWSDARVKANIEDYPTELGFDFINELAVREYNPIDVLAEGYDSDAPQKFISDEKRVGLVMQEVPEIIQDKPPAETNDEGQTIYGSVNYLGVVPYLISAVQELTKQNKALEQRITELEGGTP